MSVGARKKILLYPTTLIKLRVAIGMMTPPTAEPIVAIPSAKETRFFHQCPIIAIVGLKITPQDS
jgi:hypothetical protein